MNNNLNYYITIFLKDYLPNLKGVDLCQVFRHIFLKDKPYLNLFQFLHQFRDPVIYLVEDVNQI